VIEATIPVDQTSDLLPPWKPRNAMPHRGLVVFPYVEDRDVIERASVVRLPSGSRIKRGLVEENCRPAIPSLTVDDACSELP
jgi:hypothetical protein